MKVARDIYPHDFLGDSYYITAIKPWDGKAAKDPDVKSLINDGVARLDQEANDRHKVPYAQVQWEADRVALLQHIEQTAFFQKVRGDLVVSLYNQKELWPKFGYEDPQLGYQPNEREAAGWRGEQVRPDPRHQEPVHLGWQPIHQRRRLQSNADDRVARDPAGGPCRRRDAAQGDLSSHKIKRLCPEWDRAAFLFHRAEAWPIRAASRMAAALPRTDGCAPEATDQTGTAQKRCEIIDLAMVVEDFIVQRGEELRETHLLFLTWFVT